MSLLCCLCSVESLCKTTNLTGNGMLVESSLASSLLKFLLSRNQFYGSFIKILGCHSIFKCAKAFLYMVLDTLITSGLLVDYFDSFLC